MRMRSRSRLLSVGALALATAVAGCLAPSYDVILRGGQLVDGDGGPPVEGDLAFAGDRIAAVGDLGRATAAVEVAQTIRRREPHSTQAPATRKTSRSASAIRGVQCTS